MEFTFADRTITINVPTHAALMNEVRRRFRVGEGFALATVNVDHLVKMKASREFLDAYAAQDLVIADGNPVVILSMLAGRPVDLLPGSDMVSPMSALAAEEGVPVALVGTTQVALDDAAQALCDKTPGLDIVLRVSPTGKFDPTGPEADAILAQLDKAQVQLCFLALGAPKQEIFAQRGRERAPKVGFAGIGAGLDFLGGHQVRAPMWMRRLALEWLWRALSNPVRMMPRYAHNFMILPELVIAALHLRGRGR